MLISLFELPFCLAHRNYHVFYYLLMGASEEERKEYKLLQPENYNYLKQVSTGYNGLCSLYRNGIYATDLI